MKYCTLSESMSEVRANIKGCVEMTTVFNLTLTAGNLSMMLLLDSSFALG